jgi:hypothetical protein
MVQPIEIEPVGPFSLELPRDVIPGYETDSGFSTRELIARILGIYAQSQRANELLQLSAVFDGGDK